MSYALNDTARTRPHTHYTRPHTHTHTPRGQGERHESAMVRAAEGGRGARGRRTEELLLGGALAEEGEAGDELLQVDRAVLVQVQQLKHPETATTDTHLDQHTRHRTRTHGTRTHTTRPHTHARHTHTHTTAHMTHAPVREGRVVELLQAGLLEFAVRESKEKREAKRREKRKKQVRARQRS
jgi:hypothetical protein